MNNEITINKSSAWNQASFAGLLLGGISIAFFIINELTAKGLNTFGVEEIESLPNWATIIFMLLNSILWTIKFVGCLYLLNFFLKQFHKDTKINSIKEISRHGRRIAFLSALFYSGFLLMYTLYISPETTSKAFDLIMSTQKMDSNTMAMLENIKADIPKILFGSNLLYCFLYGTVASSFLSRRIIIKKYIIGD